MLYIKITGEIAVMDRFHKLSQFIMRFFLETLGCAKNDVDSETMGRRLHAAGYRLNVSDLVEARAQQAQLLGVDGLVSSPEEAASLRKIVGHQMNLVTPGIRPAGTAAGDQKRIMTPARAIAAGADYLVVGRPVIEAADPRAVAEAIQAEIAQALA